MAAVSTITTTQRRLAISVATVVSSAVAMTVADYQVNHPQRPLRPLEQETYATSTTTTENTASPSLSNLKRDGVTIVHNVIDNQLQEKIRHTEVYRTMPQELRRPSTSKNRRRGPPGIRSNNTNDNEEDDLLWPPSAKGRYHRREDSFSPNDIQVFEEIEEQILPLVLDFFAVDEEDEETNKEVSNSGDYETDGSFGGEIFRSEMQIFNAVPGSKSQSWHSDNQCRGITIIIPLTEFTVENGPTQVLVGSHDNNNGGNGYFSYLRYILQNGAKVITAPVGSIAAYDSRIYHRGLGNNSNIGRPAIIFCYDRITNPPPGIGNYGSLRNSYWAGMLHILSSMIVSTSSSSSTPSSPSSSSVQK